MTRLPSLFVSHGAPDFALHPGEIGPKLQQLGRELPRPTAILIVSPHWETAAPRVSASAQPETLHDFGGFDPALYQMRYPAPGDPALADRVVQLLHEAGWHDAGIDAQRGLDHGAWVPLRYLYPDADIPTLQVSLPTSLDGDTAYRYGQVLAPLAEEGILIIGSGSLTHNLRDVFYGTVGSDYAQAFSAWIRAAVRRGDAEALRRALNQAPHARQAHPTPEHYWPLVVAAGAGAGAAARVLEGGMTYEVLSMDSFVFA